MSADRPMAAETRRWLDGLTGPERRMIRHLATEVPGGWVSRLLQAMAAQLVADDFVESRTLQGHERDRVEDLEAADLAVNGAAPPVEGVAATFDPDTGEWTS